jgi:hypothetical protein
LAIREFAYIDRAINGNAHLLQRVQMGHGRDQQASIVAERNESAIEQVVDRRSQHETVLAVEALWIRAVSPWLAMTGAKVFGLIDAGDATPCLEFLNALTKLALAASGKHEGRAVGLRDRCIPLDLQPQVFLPQNRLGTRTGYFPFQYGLGAGQGSDLGTD